MIVKPILVTGATGKTGSRIASILEKEGHPVRRGSRSSECYFDWQQPESWVESLANVRAVYICYYPDFAFPGALTVLENFIDQAKSANVEQVVMITGRGESSAQRAEKIILKSGLDATVLRSAWFAQNFSEGSLLAPLMSGVVPMPGDGIAEPLVDLDDFAEVAARVLTEFGHEGKTYEVTGPELINFEQVAEIFSQVLNRSIQYVPITFEQFHRELEQATDILYADIVTNIARETFDGRNAKVGDGVAQVLHRKPHSFYQFAEKALVSGIWNLTA